MDNWTQQSMSKYLRGTKKYYFSPTECWLKFEKHKNLNLSEFRLSLETFFAFLQTDNIFVLSKDRILVRDRDSKEFILMPGEWSQDYINRAAHVDTLTVVIKSPEDWLVTK